MKTLTAVFFIFFYVSLFAYNKEDILERLYQSFLNKDLISSMNHLREWEREFPEDTGKAQICQALLYEA